MVMVLLLTGESSTRLKLVKCASPKYPELHEQVSPLETAVPPLARAPQHVSLRLLARKLSYTIFGHDVVYMGSSGHNASARAQN